ncbi:EthD domain-containing protein [Rhizorhabdus dicambivorans]|uniref:Ethyl tert-butyl ether degradation protein EthD n=1 Tax=Rhizorhabdus dicambivorans TaxID=1850238 RepID=A0A2A4FYZ0_9SPHN|nr:EthD domain-containing protein [Rhizorhabdus dicambivorans]ATE65852.1 ethyl tert-butyl ether degradation protein EthD [Rhizorhabdus dicambivorans]PCE42966.1 ethyl tert-butyl ether degradation protein EthD [Rhizorhabdus dicambivorans]
MYKVMAFLSRKPGISREEFRAYYEGQHAPLVGRLAPKMAVYRRNFLNFDEPFKRDDDQIGFDVVTEMEFEDRAACERWFSAFRDPAVFEQVAADEAKFLDSSRVMVCAVEVEQSA